MAKLNRSGELLGRYMEAPVEEGDGFIGGLEVFHQLHCLVRISSPIHVLHTL